MSLETEMRWMFFIQTSFMPYVFLPCKKVHGNCFRGIPEPLPRFGKTTWNDAML